MRYFVAIALLLTLLGCGYHFPGKSGALPGGGKTLYAPLFLNRTAEPQLENLLSNDVSEVFGRNANISQVEDLSLAEAVLEGVINSYQVSAVSYDSNDDISEYRVSITVSVKLRNVADGRMLWQGEVSWNDEYLADDNKSVQEDLERDAVEEISLRIAEEVMSRLLDDF